MLHVIKGNLLTAPEQYICHQTNCISNKAAHLAYDVFKAFPHANIYAARAAPDKPGTIIVRGDGDKQRLIINMLAQHYPGRPQLMNAATDSSKIREQYFYDCLVAISKLPNLQSIAFPMGIGCGAAMGNWEHYLEMLTRFAKYVFKHQQTKVVIYEYVK